MHRFPLRKPTCLLGLVVGLAMAALPALACEKHLDGHQTNAQTQAELQGERR